MPLSRRTPRQDHSQGRRLIAGAAAALALAATASCGTTAGHAGGIPSAATAAESGPPIDLASLVKTLPCPQTVNEQPASRPELRDFRVVAAFTCSDIDQAEPNGDTWIVEVRKATNTGLDRLVNAFNEPSQAPTDGACAAVGTVWPPLLLVAADGSYLVPPEPVDDCGMPLGNVMKTVGAVSWTTISQRKKALSETADAAATGCAMQFKNLIFLYQHDNSTAPRRSPGGPVFSEQPKAHLTICDYHVAAEHMEVGTFVRGVRLDTAESAALRNALTGAGPSPTANCAAQQDFAVVSREGGGWIFLELGGCWRLLRDDNGPETIGTVNSPRTVEDYLGPN